MLLFTTGDFQCLYKIENLVGARNLWQDVLLSATTCLKAASLIKNCTYQQDVSVNPFILEITVFI